MGKLNKDSKGFGVVELLIIIVIIVALGLMGWYVYKNHKTTPYTAIASKTTTTTKSPITTNSSSPTKITTITNPYAGWKTYRATDGTSFQYPTNWILSTTSSQYVTLDSPVDNHTNLQYQLSYGPTYNRTGVISETVANKLSLGVTLVKPLYMLALDFNNSSGKDIDGLYVTDSLSVVGDNLTSSFVGFTPKNSNATIAFEAVLQSPNYQNNGGETLATYQSSLYYQTVVNIFKSIQ